MVTMGMITSVPPNTAINASEKITAGTSKAETKIGPEMKSRTASKDFTRATCAATEARSITAEGSSMSWANTPCPTMKSARAASQARLRARAPRSAASTRIDNATPTTSIGSGSTVWVAMTWL